jgi:CopG family transcriptional regulator / antitoxin EndoAI
MKNVSSRYKRINISIPSETLQLLNDIAPPKKRSQIIVEAVTQYANTIKRLQLREQLKAGYLANAESDRQIAEEWFLIDQEAYDKDVLDKDEENRSEF